jgi:hypothetical protein
MLSWRRKLLLQQLQLLGGLGLQAQLVLELGSHLRSSSGWMRSGCVASLGRLSLASSSSSSSGRLQGWDVGQLVGQGLCNFLTAAAAAAAAAGWVWQATSATGLHSCLVA